MCCNQAKRDGYKYAWVDTCCIEKNSSAELQEAINSMYRWYSEAAVCYAYLSDVVGPDSQLLPIQGQPVVYARMDFARTDCPDEG